MLLLFATAADTRAVPSYAADICLQNSLLVPAGPV